MTVAGFKRKWDALNLKTESETAIAGTSHAIVDLNVEQMNEGLRSDGTDIRPFYKPLTIQIKQEKGQPIDRVTLRDTGDFQSATYVTVENGHVITSSTDPKTAKLNEKYSTRKGNIHGLSKEFKKQYIKEDLRPAFIKGIRKSLNLK